MRGTSLTTMNAPASSSTSRKKTKPIRVISKDMVRTLRPHDGQPAPNRQPFVLSNYELDRIKLDSIASKSVPTGSHVSPKQAISQTAQERMERIQKYDQLLRQSAANRPSDHEELSKQTEDILRRAQRQLEEEEDEIKKMNEYILHTKCMIIREAQMAERHTIKNSEKEEELRLDTMMEADRVRDIQRIIERENGRKDEMKQGAMVIRQQIEERKEALLLEAEKKEREAQANVKVWKEQQQKDREMQIEKKRKQKEHLTNVQMANREVIERKRLERMREREEDWKIIHYLMEKAKIEEERDQEEKNKKAEREKELERVHALQQRLQGTRAEQDALRAKRAMEAYEREWRRKEKESTLKKQAQEKELREARWRQQLDREHVIAVEAMKTKREFYDMLQRQKEAEEKISTAKKEKEGKMTQFSAEIKQQINERAQYRQAEGEKYRMEGLMQHKERQARKEKLEGVKQRKLHELRLLGVPEKFCNQISRKMKHLECDKISNHPSFRPRLKESNGKKAE